MALLGLLALPRPGAAQLESWLEIWRSTEAARPEQLYDSFLYPPDTRLLAWTDYPVAAGLEYKYWMRQGQYHVIQRNVSNGSGATPNYSVTVYIPNWTVPNDNTDRVRVRITNNASESLPSRRFFLLERDPGEDQQMLQRTLPQVGPRATVTLDYFTDIHPYGENATAQVYFVLTTSTRPDPSAEVQTSLDPVTVTRSNGWQRPGPGFSMSQGLITSTILTTPPGVSVSEPGMGSITGPRIGYASTCGFRFPEEPAPPDTPFHSARNFPLAGGEHCFNIIGEGGCDWEAREEASWVTVLAPTRGSGSARICYRVEENTLSAPRVASIFVGGLEHQIFQDGVVPCSTILSDEDQEFGPTGGEHSFNIVVPQTCTWTVDPEAGWITILGPTSGSNFYSGLRYRVAPTDTTETRTATIRVNTELHTVLQQGYRCSFRLEETEKAFGADGGSHTVAVSAPDVCNWEPVEPADWIRIIDYGGIGFGNVTYAVDPNPFQMERRGTFKVGDETHTVIQEPLVPVTNQAPAAPPLVAPMDRSAPVLPVSLQIGDFFDADGDAHAATQWQTDVLPEFQEGTQEFETAGADLTALQLGPAELQAGREHFWRARVQDSQGNWSFWSEIRAFTPQAPATATPSPSPTPTPSPSPSPSPTPDLVREAVRSILGEQPSAPAQDANEDGVLDAADLK